MLHKIFRPVRSWKKVTERFKGWVTFFLGGKGNEKK